MASTNELSTRLALTSLSTGNFHALILFKDDKELEKVSEAVHRLVHRAIALDGTCKHRKRFLPFHCLKSTVRLIIGTGEHGVGVGKKEYLVEELGENTIDLMRTVKNAIDPFNIMNPSKVSLSVFSALRHMLTSILWSKLYPDPSDKPTKH